jgi:class 3 adenylate cyclase
VSEPLVTLPLPEHPALAAWAAALNDAGYWAYVLDADWRIAFVTNELRQSLGDAGARTAAPVGSHWFSAETSSFIGETLRGDWSDREFLRKHFQDFGRYVLATAPGGHDRLRKVVDPAYVDLIDEIQPKSVPNVWTMPTSFGYAGANVAGRATNVRVDGDDGNMAGVCLLLKPAVGMSQLAAAAAMADLSHLERMRSVEYPDRHPAAILMADLEASTPLARVLSTAQYFAFVRRLVRAADRRIVDLGGIVGRHSGDGIVGFFLAETAGSESTAARSCIAAAAGLRGALVETATRSEIDVSNLSVRFGLHWGSTLYMGRILTAGRSEVTALGDEVNEAARIEACATGGRTLASKSLIERLTSADADALGLDILRATYTPLAELATATDKARRDAPSIAVCEI